MSCCKRFSRFWRNESLGPGYRARVQGADLLEYLRLLLETGKTVKVEATDRVGRASRLYLANGDVVHAVQGDLVGEEAFRSALGFAGGTLAALPWTEPDEVSIRKPRGSLLNEAAEAIARAKGPAPTRQA